MSKTHPPVRRVRHRSVHPRSVHSAQPFHVAVWGKHLGLEPATTSTEDSLDPICGVPRTRSMVHGENRIPYWIDRSLTGLAGPDYDATISFGLPFELEDSQ